MTAGPVQHPAAAADVDERAEYLDRDGERLYCVHHRTRGPRRGGVLLVPPFGRERLDSYASLVAWSRRLCADGFDVLRFDLRGTGESTGRFEHADLQAWLADTAFVAAALRARLQTAPMLLHGVRFGGLLAARAFAAGTGDALLLWDPPAAARTLLQEVLRTKLLEDMAVDPGAPRKTREAYVQDLLDGRLVDVEGHPWSRRLWDSSADFTLQLPPESEPRPWQLIELVRNPKLRALPDGKPWKVPIPTPPFWREKQTMRPDLGELFDCSSGWLGAAVRDGANRA